MLYEGFDFCVDDCYLRALYSVRPVCHYLVSEHLVQMWHRIQLEHMARHAAVQHDIRRIYSEPQMIVLSSKREKHELFVDTKHF